MTRTLFALALIFFLGSALAPAFASDAVCRKGTIEIDGVEEAMLAFAWEGRPAPLARGIMFETLLDRGANDNEFVALVAPESCSVWKAPANVEGRIELRFFDGDGKALVLGDGNALARVESCDEKATRLMVRVDKSFNIGMPPS